MSDTGDKISIHGLLERLPFTGRGTDLFLSNFEQQLETLELVLQPSYQRANTRWSTEQQEAFVGHVLTGGKVPALIVREIGDSDAFELVDGLQRMTALRAWMAGTIPARIGARRIFIDQTDRKFRSLCIRLDYVRCDQEIDILRLYVRLNRGVAHTAEELGRVEARIAELEAAA